MSEPELGTLILLSRLSKRAVRATPEPAMGLSMRHYMALWFIQDSVPQSQLAEALWIDANNTVLLLNELEAAGWVVRERDPSDRRRHLVRLTDAGRAKIEHALRAREIVEDEVLGPLSARERATLHELLAKALGEPERAQAAEARGAAPARQRLGATPVERLNAREKAASEE